MEAVIRLSCSDMLTDWLLADPLVQLVMRADRVNPSELRNLLFSLNSRREPTGDRSLQNENDAYRAGVGIMLLNPEGQIFVGRRLRGCGGGWQMPQGGVEPGEKPIDAARRELREEIGTDNAELLGEADGWLRYDLPPELLGRTWQGRWRGQRQKWFAMSYLGQDQDIQIATEHPEFSAWRWADPAELPTLIVSFKRQLYTDILQQFSAVTPSSTGRNQP